MLLSLWVLFAPTSGGPTLFEGSDKVVHVVLFALLAATTRWRFGALTAGLLALVGYAALSEVAQGLLLAERSGDVLDVLADLVGVALGWAAGRRLRN